MSVRIKTPNSGKDNKENANPPIPKPVETTGLAIPKNACLQRRMSANAALGIPSDSRRGSLVEDAINSFTATHPTDAVRGSIFFYTTNSRTFSMVNVNAKCFVLQQARFRCKGM